MNESYKPPNPTDGLTMRPDLVRGFVMEQNKAVPDRFFYILEPNAGGDRVWEIDGYYREDPVTGEPKWLLHITCPVCEHLLQLDSEKKPVEITARGLETGEPMHCSWPGDFGQAECTWAIELQPPKQDLLVRARRWDGTVVRVRIDAIARRA